MRFPAGQSEAGKLAARVFATLAAIFLVGSVAMGSILPPDMTLYGALHALDSDRADAAQTFFVTHFGHDAWSSFAVPLLLRPAWLLPFCLGLIFAGGGVSSSFHAAPRARRGHS